MSAPNGIDTIGIFNIFDRRGVRRWRCASRRTSSGQWGDMLDAVAARRFRTEKLDVLMRHRSCQDLVAQVGEELRQTRLLCRNPWICVKLALCAAARRT